MKLIPIISLILTAILAAGCGSSESREASEPITTAKPQPVTSVVQGALPEEIRDCTPRDAQRPERWVGDLFAEENLCPLTAEDIRDELWYGTVNKGQSVPPTPEEWANILKSEIKDYEEYLNGLDANLYLFAYRNTVASDLCSSFWELRYASNRLFWWTIPQGIIQAFPSIQSEVEEIAKDEIKGRSLITITEEIITNTLPEVLENIDYLSIENPFGEVEYEGIDGYGSGLYEEIKDIHLYGTDRLKEGITNEDADIILKSIRPTNHHDILTDEIWEFLALPQPAGCGYTSKTILANDASLIEENAPPDPFKEAEIVIKVIADFRKNALEAGLYVNRSDPKTPYGAICWVLWEEKRIIQIIQLWHTVEYVITSTPEITDLLYQLLAEEINGRTIKGMLQDFADNTIPELQRVIRSTGIDSDEKEWSGDPLFEEYGTLLVKRMDKDIQRLLDFIEDKGENLHAASIEYGILATILNYTLIGWTGDELHEKVLRLEAILRDEPDCKHPGFLRIPVVYPFESGA